MTQPMNPAMRDALVEMMGGCRHVFPPDDASYAGPCCIYCGKSTRELIMSAPGAFTKDFAGLPAVGDGHEPTLEALLEWWRAKVRLPSIFVRWYGPVCWVSVGYDQWGHEDIGTGTNENPKVAAVEAILRSKGQWTEAMRGA